MRALIVDDDEDIRQLVRLTMEFAGVEVVAEAADAPAAVQSWGHHHPDVVILDYRLPGDTGLEAAASILRDDPEARIVMYSSYLDDRTVERAEAMGVRACVSKEQLRQLPAIAADAVR